MRLHAARKFLAVLEAADAVGLLDRLSAPTDAAALAAATDTRPELVERLLRVLGWHEVAVRDAHGRWSAGPGMKVFLGSPGGADDARGLLRIERWAAGDHLDAAGLVAALRGRECDTAVPEDVVGELGAAMAVGARSAAPHVARLPELRGVGHLADVGGGSAGYTVALCRLRAGMRATVYDRAPMLEHAAEAVGRAGLDERVDLVPWDMTAHALPAGHDGALLSHVLHLLPRAGRRDLLDRVRAAVEPGAVLVVHDFLYDDPEPLGQLAGSAVDWIAAGSDFVLTSGELVEELAASGFHGARTVSPPTLSSGLVVARA
jgi:hypothetical protein